MPLRVLVERSGLSRATVCRLLSGKEDAKFTHVVAIARILGVELVSVSATPTEKIIETQARQQAQRAFRLTQGTMGLEAQGVEDNTAVEQLIEGSVQRFLKGPRNRLWSQ
jgi:hypothetical protein